MEQYSFAYQRYLKTELPEEIQQLVAAADKATEKAYAPYSKFQVGSAVLMTDGSIVTGANQENASYSNGICAERAALSGIVINDQSPKVKAIAIAYYEETKLNEMPLAPCGMCRQTILEMQQRQQEPIHIYMCSPSGQVIMVEDAEFLLPFSFGSNMLPGVNTQV